jgi:hypothetical protein
MGDSACHRFVYETLLRHPGLVTLHDFSLAGFQDWYARQPGMPPDYLACEIDPACTRKAREWRSLLKQWASEPGGVPEQCRQRGLYLNAGGDRGSF